MKIQFVENISHSRIENPITDEIAAIITEMERNGITKRTAQSEILERDHGVKIAPHFERHCSELTTLSIREASKYI
ncbi:MAG: hypothetical protein LBS31_03500 [Candidatus Adiutrix sp.]|jgi:hypothetical protein|nr:hypothetical protein [Candidatus Adiutrix sp.]